MWTAWKGSVSGQQREPRHNCKTSSSPSVLQSAFPPTASAGRNFDRLFQCACILPRDPAGTNYVVSLPSVGSQNKDRWATTPSTREIQQLLQKKAIKIEILFFFLFLFFLIRTGQFNFLTPFLFVSTNILIRNGKAIITQETQLEEASSKESRI